MVWQYSLRWWGVWHRGYPMSDPNRTDFYRRVGRIEQAHALGLGFEAEGTLGRSGFRPVSARRRSVVRICAFLVCFCFGMKGAVHYSMGAEAFDARVAQIEARGGVDAVQGFLMRPDPVTVLISKGIAIVVDRTREAA